MLVFGASLQLQIRDEERIPYNKAGRTAADTLTPPCAGVIPLPPFFGFVATLREAPILQTHFLLFLSPATLYPSYL
jgi:hypothetical protein